MASFMDKVSNFFSGNDSDTSEGLRGLFVTELKDIYYAEQQAVDVLGTQADAATTDEVRNAFLQHQEETRNQIARLEQVFDSIGVEVEEGTCEAIDGLAEDGQRVVANTESGSLTRDAGLIMAGQKVEHHEIASYGSAVTLANVLGYSQAAQLLHQTLEEEKATDKKLTQLAESFINNRAKSEDNNNDNGSNPDYTATNIGSTVGGGSTYQSGESYNGSQTSNTTKTTTDREHTLIPPYDGGNNQATSGGPYGV